jgi:DNA-binding FadR family transcriptional regulator
MTKKYKNCDEVFKTLQKYFSEKSFETGERVPSERQIADDLCVNRTTLRTAMHRMVKDGLLERQIGVGTFFKISPKELAENYTKINTKCTYTELFEARILLEPKLANLAALNICAEDIKKLKDAVRLSKKIQPSAIEKLDIEFHDMIADLAKNSMLKEMYSVVSSLRKKLLNSPKDMSCDSFQCSEMWMSHQNTIINALEKKDAKAAYNAVKEKLNCVFGQHSVLN